MIKDNSNSKFSFWQKFAGKKMLVQIYWKALCTHAGRPNITRNCGWVGKMMKLRHKALKTH
jgi:hypothetical protein